MKAKYQFLMLGMAAMLASCSQNDELQINESNEPKAMTITATLPEGMTTRANAQGDEEVKRCYVQVIETTNGEANPYNEVLKMDNGSEAKGFSTTIYLNPEATYTFLFWADCGDSYYTIDANAANALSNITLAGNAQASIAYFGSKTGQSWSETGITCVLTHAVAKISVDTTGELTTSSTNNVTVTLPANVVYSAFNVSTGSVTGSVSASAYTHSFESDATFNANSRVGSFYVLVASAENYSLTLQYNGVKNNPAETLSNVPLAPNKHVILKGDVANAGLVAGGITATINAQWDEATETFPEETQTPAGEEAGQGA